MILVMVRNKYTEKEMVEQIVYQPNHPRLGITKEHIDEKGIYVEDVPEFSGSLKRGQSAVLYINPQTKSMWHEIVDRPLTPEEEAEVMKEKQELMQQALDELIFGGAL